MYFSVSSTFLAQQKLGEAVAAYQNGHNDLDQAAGSPLKEWKTEYIRLNNLYTYSQSSRYLAGVRPAPRHSTCHRTSFH